MKALTLTQPWATLVAIGAKRIETRSWNTAYRGPLAIHAAKGFPADARDFLYAKIVLELLAPYFSAEIPLDKQLPRGCMVATCSIEDILPMESTGCLAGIFENYPELDTEQERAFGNYDTGRWAWVLTNIKPLKVPLPVTGALGLWNWT